MGARILYDGTLRTIDVIARAISERTQRAVGIGVRGRVLSVPTSRGARAVYPGDIVVIDDAGGVAVEGRGNPC